MKVKQLGKPYKVIEKDEFLKYEDNGYIKPTPELEKLYDFIKNDMKQKRHEDIFDDLSFELRLFDNSASGVTNCALRLSDGKPFKSREQLAKYLQLCFDAQNPLSKQCNHGYAWRELEEKLGGLPGMPKVSPEMIDSAAALLDYAL